MKKYIRNLLLICLLCATNISCTNWLTIQPETQLTGEEMFKSKAGFNDALIGIYINMQKLYKASTGSKLVVGFVENLACQWDNVKPGTNEELMTLHEYYDLDEVYKDIFRDMYKVIANINVIMPNLENGVLDKISYSKIKGELLALRAYVHFDLCRLWGPIPSSYSKNKTYLPYVKTVQIAPYKYITHDEYMADLNNDLAESHELLEYWYANDVLAAAYEKSDYLRLPQVDALQSRVALWQGNKAKAIEHAEAVMEYINEENKYKLANIASVNNGDLSLRTEHIFGITSTVDRGFSTTQFIYDENLMELYEGDGADMRLYMWQDDINQKDKPAKNSIKYYIEDTGSEDGQSGYTMSVPMIRTAEIYLLLIECLDLDEANVYYEQFCRARGINYTPIKDIYQRSEILLKEYRKEFIAEGQLFYAYKRWNMKNMPKCIRPCGTDSYVIPIPRREFDLNL